MVRKKKASAWEQLFRDFYPATTRKKAGSKKKTASKAKSKTAKSRKTARKKY